MTMTSSSRRGPATGDPVAARPYQELKGTTLGQVRATFSPACYERSSARALRALAFDAALYGVLLAGVFLADGVATKLVLGMLAGCAVAFLFVWAHDAAHGALFASSRVAEVLGTIAMLPSLQMYRLWAYGHNRVHHGFTSLSSVDWIWRPRTPAEYDALSRWQRGLYRLERHPATCALHYLLRVWWPGMVRFRPDPRSAHARSFRWSKLGMLAFVLAFSAVAYVAGGGVPGVVAAVVVPFVVFTYFIAFFVYLHHTHPDVPFFDDRKEWSATIGQVACSTVVRTNVVVEHLTHGILLHAPHHIDSRIPFYNLERAYRDLEPTYGQYVQSYRFRVSTVGKIFRRCQLYDFDTHTWHRFRSA